MNVHPLAHVHAPHGPPRVVAVHTIAWVLVCVALWDGGGLAFGGNHVTSSPSYAALRLVPGGMRTWGVLLLAGAAWISWGISEDSNGHPKALNRVLAVGVLYYGVWTIVIPGTWYIQHQIPAWGGPSKTAALAVLYYICARAVAPPHTARGGTGAR